MSNLRPVALVYNAAAGSMTRLRGRRSLNLVAEALRHNGGAPELLPTRGPRDGFARGEEAGRRFPVVAVFGGDGTINEVLNGLIAAGSNARVLVLPGGTVNVLARDLRIPLDPCRAAALLREGLDRRMFLGRAGNRYFVLMASAGVDASIVCRLSHTNRKRRFGPLAFVVEGLRHTVAYDSPLLSVRSDSRVVEGYLAVVGNSPGYGGWFSVTPGADPGQLGFQVAVCTSRRKLKYYYFLALAMAGALHRSPDFIHFDASHLRITSDRPAYVQVDGEPHEMLPMDFVSDGTSLQFLVPPGRQS